MPATQALLVQNNLLLLLVYRYQRRSLGRTLGLLALLGGSGYSVAVGRVSKALITRAYDAQNAIIVASRWAGRLAGLAELAAAAPSMPAVPHLPQPPSVGQAAAARLPTWPAHCPDRAAPAAPQAAPDPGQLPGARHRPAEPDHVWAQHRGRRRPHLHFHPGAGGGRHGARLRHR